jgi:hypothetical protein
MYYSENTEGMSQMGDKNDDDGANGFKSGHLRGDAWLVYDGLCPLCSAYSRFIRLRETVGKLHLVDARQPSALLDEITAAGLNIDRGMVLKFNDVIYYDSDASYMLTLLSSPLGPLNRLNYLFFGSRLGARIFYPSAKAVRTVTLKLLRIPYIENLKQAKSQDSERSVHSLRS